VYTRHLTLSADLAKHMLPSSTCLAFNPYVCTLAIRLIQTLFFSAEKTRYRVGCQYRWDVGSCHLHATLPSMRHQTVLGAGCSDLYAVPCGYAMFDVGRFIGASPCTCSVDVELNVPVVNDLELAVPANRLRKHQSCAMTACAYPCLAKYPNDSGCSKLYLSEAGTRIEGFCWSSRFSS